MKLLRLEAQVAGFVAKTQLFPREEAIVAGVSGGPDSVAMLLAVAAVNAHRQAHWRLHVAHLNHQLRGVESDEDAAFVRRLSEGLSLPFHLSTQNVAAFARTEKLGIEEAARRARYGFFRAIAHETGSRVVTIGHTSDDHVETVLHRIFRGTGVRGLAGIPEVREIDRAGPIFAVRPLLRVWRREVLEYLAHKGQSYRIDATNQDVTYRRNWVRHKLVPLLERQYGGQVGPAVARLADIAGELMDDVDARVHEAWDCVLTQIDERGVELDRGLLASLSPALREPILRRACREMGLGERALGFAAWRRLMNFATSPETKGRLFLPGAYAERTADRIALRRHQQPAHVEWNVPLLAPGHVCLADVGLQIAAEEGRPASLSDLAKARTASGREEFIDADRIVPPLVVRRRRQGDAFHPLGAPGRRKLKRFLIDHKVAASLRDSIPLLVDQIGIVWVVGHRIDERVKITPATKRVLRLSVSPAPG